MAVGRFCIDTNAVVGFLEGDDALAAIIRKGHEELLLPAVVVGELLFGARNSTRVQENMERYRRFIHHCDVMPIDGDTSEIYAELKTELRSGGFKIPDNDVWIAAISVQHDATVLTQDRHFSYIGRIETRGW